jgi:hypothetical protein
MSVGKKGDRSLGGCSAIGNEGALLIEESLPTSAPWLSVGRREMPSRLPLSVGIGSVDGLSRSIRMVPEVPSPIGLARAIRPATLMPVVPVGRRTIQRGRTFH